VGNSGIKNGQGKQSGTGTGKHHTPPQFDSADWIYDDQWGLDTDGEAFRHADREYRMLAANDHAGYYGSLVSPQFRSYGQDNPFGQYLATTGLANAEQHYTNLLMQNRNLRFNTFMKRLGAGATPGRLQELGTGQRAVDTGNPFTSASGFGGPPGMPKGITNFPRNRKDVRAYEKTELGASPFGTGKRWLKSYRNSPLGKQTGGVQKFSDVGTSYTDMLRRQFLSLSPAERGEVAQGKTAVPGRWSPWG
jgi:hypothetical protein